MSLEEKWSDLSDELKTKAKACANAEELVALAEAEGLELSDSELDAIAGGFKWSCSQNQPYES